VDAFRLDTINSYFHDRDLRDNPPLPEDQRGERPKVNPFAQQLHLYDRAQRGDLAPLEAFVAAIEMHDKATIVGQLGNRLKTSGRQGLRRCYTYTLPSAEFSAEGLSKAVDEAVENSPDGRICWALSNHDTTRHVTRFGAEDQDMEAVAKLSATLLACLPGAISLYQGEELGLPESVIGEDQLHDPFGQAFWPAIKGRDGCRTPLPWDSDQTNAGFSSSACWLPVSPDHKRWCVASQQKNPASVLSHYRRMIDLRKQSAALSSGDFESLGHSGEVFGFLRRGAGETVLAAFNCGREPAEISVPDDVAGLRQIGEPIGAGSLEAGRVALPGLSFFVGRLAE
jgi:alpha-glucosidase